MTKQNIAHEARGTAPRTPPGKKPGWLRVAAGLVTGVALLFVLVVGAVGWVGSERGMHPARNVEDHSLSEYAFANSTEDLRFDSLDGTPLASWLVPGKPKAATIILLHGYGRSRAELLPHADYLHQAGYNVLLLDFRNRGESGGDAVTTGAMEPLDVRGAVSYLLTRPDVDPERIAVQGVSMGASSGIMAVADDPRIAAIVSESAFTDLRATIARSFEHFINLPTFPFAPVTVLIIEQRLGADADDVRPIDAIGRLGQRPVFIIEDLWDSLMPEDSGRRLYEAASGPKQVWFIEGAGHAEGFKVQPEEYRRRVLKFYEEYMSGR